MIVEFHAASSLTATMRVDYDCQAEQAVREFPYRGREIVMVILRDEEGERCIWERQDAGMALVMLTHRFTGQWSLGASALDASPGMEGS